MDGRGLCCAVKAASSVQTNVSNHHIQHDMQDYHTIETRLTQLAISYNARHSRQACPELFTLLKRAVSVSQGLLKLLVWLLAFQLSNPGLEAFDGVLRAFANVALGFTVVGSLFG